MIQSGAYSAKYQHLAHEQFLSCHEQKNNQSKKARSKERSLSKETKRRQKALEDRKRQMEENEEERRQAVLKERRREQDRAMASFRQTAHPRVKAVGAALVRRQDSSRVQCGKDIPTTLDAKEIADMVSGKVQVSVPSLDEMLGQLRDNTPVPSHEPLSVCRARETHAAAGSGAEGGSPLIPHGGTPEVQLDTNTGPESPGNIYTRMNYASLAQDSLEEEGDVRQPSPHALSSQWAEKVCPWDSLEESSSGLHLAEPVLGISRELERVASSRPSTHSEADLLARLSSATNPKLPPNNGIRQPTSILKKSGQKAMLKQILSNAAETSSPPANADCKHVRFADDPSSVWEADSEIDDLEASFRAKASSGSSPHFLFSHGSEFAFRPLRNGLVPIPAGEKPLHGPSHQSDSVARLTAAPASSSQCASSSTTMDHPATAPSLPQSSLTKTHTGGSNRKERQDEGALNQTPTDDQISKLWSQMRGYMAENKALQATQRAGLQRLKQSTQRGWQHRQRWGTMVQTEQPASRRNAPEMLRGVGDSPSRGPLPGASLTAQEWRGSWRGSGQVHPAASEVERVRCSPQVACSQQEPADCSVPRGKKLSLRQQEQQLMESIERLNSQLNLKLPMQTAVPKNRPSHPLAPPTSSVPSSQTRSRMTRAHSGSAPMPQKRALRDLPNARTSQNPQTIALAADHHAQAMNSHTELSMAFHRQQHYH